MSEICGLIVTKLVTCSTVAVVYKIALEIWHILHCKITIGNTIFVNYIR